MKGTNAQQHFSLVEVDLFGVSKIEQSLDNMFESFFRDVFPSEKPTAAEHKSKFQERLKKMQDQREQEKLKKS